MKYRDANLTCGLLFDQNRGIEPSIAVEITLKVIRVDVRCEFIGLREGGLTENLLYLGWETEHNGNIEVLRPGCVADRHANKGTQETIHGALTNEANRPSRGRTD